MKKPFTALASLFILIFLLCSTGAYAQTTPTAKPKKTVDVKAKAVVKSRGANPNIKQDMPTTDVRRTKSRGAATCNVTIDNETELWVKIYVDGKFAGYLAPEAVLQLPVANSYNTIYCITPGATQEWNASGNCATDYTYKLLEL